LSQIDNISKEKLPYKDAVCDGFGCSKKPTENIELHAGTFGTISLNLCKSCLKKFSGSKN